MPDKATRMSAGAAPDKWVLGAARMAAAVVGTRMHVAAQV